MCLYIDDEEHELGDHDEPANYKDAFKWLFKKKTDIDGTVQTYKGCLVAKGFTQTNRVDYEETFSPVAEIRAIRILIAIAAFYDYEIWQMDVKTAFLNGHLSKEVYMVQPKGFLNPKFSNRVCKLKRSIYGLKQASRQWNKRFDDEIKKFGFSQNHDEPCVYMKASGSYVTFLILYVNDILIMGNNIPMLQDVKSYLGICFAMKDLGEAAYILGIKIY
ncbi:retrotransposon protein, putative, ty1-copia subclass [Tanacetum coccineum]